MTRKSDDRVEGYAHAYRLGLRFASAHKPFSCGSMRRVVPARPGGESIFDSWNWSLHCFSFMRRTSFVSLTA